MSLDPQAKMLLDQLASMGAPPLHTLSVDLARQAMREMAALSSVSVELARVEDRTLPGPGGDIPVRIYVPGASADYPVLVYFHGGGWVIGDRDTHDNICRLLAHDAGCIVVSVDY